VAVAVCGGADGVARAAWKAGASGEAAACGGEAAACGGVYAWAWSHGGCACTGSGARESGEEWEPAVV
jgi:hypothetical protein